MVHILQLQFLRKFYLCDLQDGGVGCILVSQARIQALCNHFWETKVPPEDVGKEEQEDWKLEVLEKPKSLHAHFNLTYLFY